MDVVDVDEPFQVLRWALHDSREARHEWSAVLGMLGDGGPSRKDFVEF